MPYLKNERDWRKIGWKPRKDRPDLWINIDYSWVEKIRGEKAKARRIAFMESYLKAVITRQAKAWAGDHPGGVTDEQIQDMAFDWVNQTFDSIFFKDNFEELGQARLADLVRWWFELAVCEAIGKPYTEYAYNDF